MFLRINYLGEFWRNTTILFFSFWVSKARLCMCIPIVSHSLAEKEPADGVLWQRWQFSAHNCTPVFADTLLLSIQPELKSKVMNNKPKLKATKNLKWE
jgi:hypothetical protein